MPRKSQANVSLLLALAGLLGACSAQQPAHDPTIFEAAGVKRVSTVQDGHLAVYNGGGWQPRFWAGINLGATTPGYFPGELSATKAYRDARGLVNPYAGYLHDLRAHHAGMPLLISEFGVPSSRGMAHYGPLGRNQGMHTEQEQGQMDAELLASIHDEGYDGGILFEWHDEWFKYTWNTVDLELPPDRRAYWRNRLTNEENFGVIAVEPGQSADDLIILDGKTDDWQRRSGTLTVQYPGVDLTVTHDEAHLYLLLHKQSGAWDFAHDQLDIGFGVLPGGSRTADQAPGISFAQGIQFLLQIKNEHDSHIFVNSAYDQHTWLYTEKLKMLPGHPDNGKIAAGRFLPWKLALSRALYLPESKQTIPFEEIDVGLLRPGISDPADPAFNSLADWYAKQDILEIRIPWMLLGYTDPSSLQVWNYPYQAHQIEPVPSPGVQVYPLLRAAGTTDPQLVEPVLYHWDKWDLPTSHERQKASYSILSAAFAAAKQLRAPP